MLLPEPEGPTRAVEVPGPRDEGDAVEHRNARLVLEGDVPELDRPLDRRESRARLVAGVLGELVADLPDPLEAGEGLGDLAADRDDLDDRADEHGRVER